MNTQVAAAAGSPEHIQEPLQEKVNLLGLSALKLEQFFADLGEKRFRVPQVLKWIHQLGVTDFSAMTNLSKALRQRLAEVAEIRFPRSEERRVGKECRSRWSRQCAQESNRWQLQT